jgi:hypothetical protein
MKKKSPAMVGHLGIVITITMLVRRLLRMATKRTFAALCCCN